MNSIWSGCSNLKTYLNALFTSTRINLVRFEQLDSNENEYIYVFGYARDHVQNLQILPEKKNKEDLIYYCLSS